MRVKKMNIAGDTIVEVLIVLAVLGLAISIAYATANRSLLDARQAQENAVATEKVQSQVELLRLQRAVTNSTDPNYIYRSGLFCMSSSGVVSGFSGADPTVYANYPAGCVDSYYHLSVSCVVDGNNTPCSLAADPRNTFQVKAVWDEVGDSGQASVTIAYKVHPQP